MTDDVEALRAALASEREAHGALTEALAVAEEALIKTTAAMEMQEGREREELHIPQPSALKIWGDAMHLARAALAKIAAAKKKD